MVRWEMGCVIRRPAGGVEGIGVCRWYWEWRAIRSEGDYDGKGQMPGQSNVGKVVGSCNQADREVFVGVEGMMRR